MNKAKYSELFVAFRKVPMKEFLELLFEGVPVELTILLCSLIIILPIPTDYSVEPSIPQ